MVVYFVDVETNNLYEVQEEQVVNFQEEYENPKNLLCVDVWYCDGGGFNGKISRMAYGPKDAIKIVETEEVKTNNEMEYMALITAIVLAEPYSLILSDSKLIVNQTISNWKCNHERLRKLRDIARDLQKIKKISIKWIPREENLAGIKLDKTKK